MEWLSSVGGIYEILEKTFGFVLGGYMLVNWKISTMVALYLDDAWTKN